MGCPFFPCLSALGVEREQLTDHSATLARAGDPVRKRPLT
jgi:hypothetical protein